MHYLYSLFQMNDIVGGHSLVQAPRIACGAGYAACDVRHADDIGFRRFDRDISCAAIAQAEECLPKRIWACAHGERVRQGDKPLIQCCCWLVGPASSERVA